MSAAVVVILFVLLGLVVLGVSLGITIPWAIRHAKAREATWPYRVPATVTATQLIEPGGGGDPVLQVHVSVAWPGDAPYDATLNEPTRARQPLPDLPPGTPIFVFVAADDRSSAHLDWARLDEQASEPSGAAKAAWTAVPQGSKGAAEAESRDWQLTCNQCGFTRSVWETGGIRYKAHGEKLTRLHCPAEDKNTGHKCWRPRDPATATT